MLFLMMLFMNEQEVGYDMLFNVVPCVATVAVVATTIHEKGVLEYDDSARDRFKPTLLIYAQQIAMMSDLMHAIGRNVPQNVRQLSCEL